MGKEWGVRVDLVPNSVGTLVTIKDPNGIWMKARNKFFIDPLPKWRAIYTLNYLGKTYQYNLDQRLRPSGDEICDWGLVTFAPNLAQEVQQAYGDDSRINLIPLALSELPEVKLTGILRMQLPPLALANRQEVGSILSLVMSRILNLWAVSQTDMQPEK